VRVTLLGSGGWMPTDERETTCVLVVKESTALCLDAGTGLRRIATSPELLDGVDRLHVVLTHWHLDHTIGLGFLPAIHVPVELWAPPPAAQLVHRLLDPPFLFGDASAVEQCLAAAHDLEPPGVQVGPFDIRVRVQPLHPSTSRAFRVDGELAVCTDTAYDEGNIDFVRAASVLLHEAYWPGEASDDGMHTAAGEAARLAAAAGVGRLVLTHANPIGRHHDAVLHDARKHFADVTLATDGLAFDVGG
jgi:ribonuclease BN (tRNA processing enzyme)